MIRRYLPVVATAAILIGATLGGPAQAQYNYRGLAEDQGFALLVEALVMNPRNTDLVVSTAESAGGLTPVTVVRLTMDPETVTDAEVPPTNGVPVVAVKTTSVELPVGPKPVPVIVKFSGIAQSNTAVFRCGDLFCRPKS